MKRLDWHGIIAVILAIGAIATVIILAIQETQHAGHLSADEVTLLSTVLGAIIGAVATFLGTKSHD